MKIRQQFERLTDRSRVFPIMVEPEARRPGSDCGTILNLEGVSVTFDGFKAIDDLSLYIDSGELRCIIGPNGAGKTTMMDVVTGKTKPDTGIVEYFGGVDLTRLADRFGD